MSPSSPAQTAIFITVRTGSTRLPEKALLPILGKTTTIEFLINHIRQAKLPQQIVLCTTTRPEDDRLIQTADQAKIRHFRGSEPDKLERWRGAAQAYDVDFFVTADGDDLFTDPELIDQAIRLYQESGCDFIHADGYPPGAFTYGIARSALEKVCEMKDTDDTEMMWGYFLDTGLFNVQKMVAPAELKRPDVRMTLDYPEDFTFFKTVFEALQIKKPLRLKDIVEYTDAHPEVVKLNQFRHKEFLANQQQKKKVILKTH